MSTKTIQQSVSRETIFGYISNAFGHYTRLAAMFKQYVVTDRHEIYFIDKQNVKKPNFVKFLFCISTVVHWTSCNAQTHTEIDDGCVFIVHTMGCEESEERERVFSYRLSMSRKSVSPPSLVDTHDTVRKKSWKKNLGLFPYARRVCVYSASRVYELGTRGRIVQHWIDSSFFCHRFPTLLTQMSSSEMCAMWPLGQIRRNERQRS